MGFRGDNKTAGSSSKSFSITESGGVFTDSSGNVLSRDDAFAQAQSKTGGIVQTHRGPVRLTSVDTSVDPTTGATVSSPGLTSQGPGGSRRERIRGDIQAGIGLGKEIIGEGSLGRQTETGQVSTKLGRATTRDVTEGLGRTTTQFRQGRSSEIADILARRKENLQGLGRQELQAERDRAGQEISRQSESQRRQLAAIQARTGVRGGTAAAQQLGAISAGAQTRANFERDLFLKNEQIKREALGQFETSVSAAEQSEFGRRAAGAELEKFNLGQQFRERGLQSENISRQLATQQFNLGQEFRTRGLESANVAASIERERFNLQQQAQEKFGQQAVALGFAQLASGEVTAEQASQAQNAAAAASSGCFAPKTAIKMKDGSFKEIEDVFIGDETAHGVVYSLFVTQAPKYDMYEYNGVVVAGSHAVYEDGAWLRIREAKWSNPSLYKDILYNVGVQGHRLSIDGMTFSDIDELDLVEEIDELYLDGLNGVA